MANNDKEKEFIIPVSWQVYSTVVVKGAKDIHDAKRIVEKNLDDIPLSRNPQYVDESYRVDIDPETEEEDLEVAQDYQTRGVLLEIDPDNPDAKPEYTVID